MSGFPNDPSFRSDPTDLTPELRDYVLACLRAARPSRLRTQAIDAFARSTPPASPSQVPPFDWQGLETEAVLRGVTVADLIAELGSDEQDPFAV